MIIDIALVKGLIAEQFPQWAHLPVTPVEPGGWDNRTFRLGTDMSVRLPSAEHYAAAVVKEQTWLPKIAPLLPLPIPSPLAMGGPGLGYPWKWSVYNWLPGEVACAGRINDMPRFAMELAAFLLALQRIDTADAPPAPTPPTPPTPPTHRYRGGSLLIWDEQARAALTVLRDDIDVDAAAAIWQQALNAEITADPVWFHGDVAAGNLLVEDGELCAVIDFGGLAVGDPACDLAIAWKFFDASSRDIFRSAYGADDAMWARGRGWALWKAMIVVANLIETNTLEAGSAQYVLDELLGAS